MVSRPDGEPGEARPPAVGLTGAPDPILVLRELGVSGWLVGGAVRDRLLGRATRDYDVALAGEVEPVARALSRAARGFAFRLSEAFGAWRVVDHGRRWQVDLLPLTADRIEDDLRRRDLTINAIAEVLDGSGTIDPCDGLSDLAARRLRAASDRAFVEDPLRVLRLARMAAELGFTAEPATVRLAARSSAGLAGVAPERQFAELRRLIVSPRPVTGLDLLTRLGATAAVLPELAALDGVAQNRFHHRDVGGHTRETLAAAVALEEDPTPAAGDRAAEVAAFMRQPLANELTRWGALRFGALLHDIAKPVTEDHLPDGRVTFIGHDRAGAEMSAAILGRLRASERLRAHVAALTRHHLRLGFLVHRVPLACRDVYDYLDATDAVAVDVTILTVADRLATGGDDAQRAIARHLELARVMCGKALDWDQHPPRSPIRGDALARSLGIPRGPRIGELLAELRAASFCGEVSTPEQALARARQRLDDR
jgi:poly(A) polymerase